MVELIETTCDGEDMINHQDFIRLIVAYTLTGAFVFTVVITCLSLVGWIKFADKKQQRKLFGCLIVELVVMCLGFFKGFLNFNVQQVAQDLVEQGKAIRKLEEKQNPLRKPLTRIEGELDIIYTGSYSGTAFGTRCISLEGGAFNLSLCAPRLSFEQVAGAAAGTYLVHGSFHPKFNNLLNKPVMMLTNLMSWDLSIPEITMAYHSVNARQVNPIKEFRGDLSLYINSDFRIVIPIDIRTNTQMQTEGWFRREGIAEVIRTGLGIQ